MSLHVLSVADGKDYEELARTIHHDFASIRSKTAQVEFKDCGKLFGSDVPRGKLRKFEMINAYLSGGGLKEGDYVFWLDSDVIVLDKTFDPAEVIESGADFICSVDPFGICMGAFAIRVGKWSERFLQAILTSGLVAPTRQQEFDPLNYRAEQMAIKVYLRYFPEIRTHFAAIPEHIIQNRLSDFSPSAWLFHFWMGGRTAQEVVRKKTAIECNGWNHDTFDLVCNFDVQDDQSVRGVAERIGVEEGDFLAILGADRTRVGDKYLLSGEEAKKIVRISNLFDFARLAHGSISAARAWMLNGDDTLGGAGPLRLCSTPQGFRKAKEFLFVSHRQPSIEDFIKGF